MPHCSNSCPWSRLSPLEWKAVVYFPTLFARGVPKADLHEVCRTAPRSPSNSISETRLGPAAEARTQSTLVFRSNQMVHPVRMRPMHAAASGGM
jgi:hypothetical protein